MSQEYAELEIPGGRSVLVVIGVVEFVYLLASVTAGRLNVKSDNHALSVEAIAGSL